MTDTLITALFSFLGVVIVALVGYRSNVVLKRLELQTAQREKQDSDSKITDELLMAMAHDRLYVLSENLIRQGYATPEERSNFEYIYEPYRRKGGNHGADNYKACIDQLPHFPTEKE